MAKKIEYTRKIINLKPEVVEIIEEFRESTFTDFVRVAVDEKIKNDGLLDEWKKLKKGKKK